VPELRQRPLDSLAFGGQELARPGRIHHGRLIEGSDRLKLAGRRRLRLAPEGFGR
jgi:hypothetical protein